MGNNLNKKKNVNSPKLDRKSRNSLQRFTLTNVPMDIRYANHSNTTKNSMDRYGYTFNAYKKSFDSKCADNYVIGSNNLTNNNCLSNKKINSNMAGPLSSSHNNIKQQNPQQKYQPNEDNPTNINHFNSNNLDNVVQGDYCTLNGMYYEYYDNAIRELVE